MIKILLIVLALLSNFNAYCALSAQEQVENLYQRLSTFNSSIKRNQAAMLWCAQNSDFYGIKDLILNKRVNPDFYFFVNTKNYIGFVSPLYFAVKTGNGGIVNFLLLNGANPNGAPMAKYTALHLAVACGHYNVVKLLLRYGAAANAQSVVDETPLYYAVKNNDLKITLLLLACGADPEAVFFQYLQMQDKKVKQQISILDFAKQLQNYEIVEALELVAIRRKMEDPDFELQPKIKFNRRSPWRE